MWGQLPMWTAAHVGTAALGCPSSEARQSLRAAEHRDNQIRTYCSTFTPFQNATYPLIFFAASFGSG
jgi:hypothetical protein